MIFLIIRCVIVGLIVGGLGRLVVRGPNPMSILVTILVGLAASFVGGFVTLALIGGGHWIISFIVSVILAAVVVSFISGSRGSLRGRRSRI